MSIVKEKGVRSPYQRTEKSSLVFGCCGFRTIKMLKKIGIVVAAAVLLPLLLLRFANPPFSALMVIRSVQESVGLRPSVGAKQWKWVRLSEVSPLLQRSVIVAEDARFLSHRGVDFSSLFSVVQGEKQRMRGPRGASTLTMQTVKNLFLWPGRSYLRKGIELVISPLFDLIVGKRRTLEIYLNIVEWGAGIYGAEAAAQRFFRKSAKNLTLSESAALAAVLPSPLTVSPRALSPAARRRLSRIVNEAGSARLP